MAGPVEGRVGPGESWLVGPVEGSLVGPVEDSLVGPLGGAAGMCARGGAPESSHWRC